MKIKSVVTVLLVFALWFFTAQLWAQDLGPKFKKIKEGIFVYAGRPNESNCTIILTQDGVVLIDSGNNPTDSHAVMKAVKQVTSQAVRFLINTEPHSDHTTGHFVFSPPAIIIAHAGAGESMRQAYNPQRNEKLMAESAEMREAFKGFRLVTPHVEYRDKMTLNVGERTLELYYLKNVHSEADTAIWLPKERVLFTAASVGVKRFNNLRPFVQYSGYVERNSDDERAQS
jgi:cyclase